MQGRRKGGGGNSPPFFGRPVNPISTRGQIMPTQILVAPSKFWTMRHLCYVNDKALDKKGSTLKMQALKM